LVAVEKNNRNFEFLKRIFVYCLSSTYFKKYTNTVSRFIMPKELVAPPPEHCPGPESEQAGKQSGCEGCPNQSVCASGAVRGPDPGKCCVFISVLIDTNTLTLVFHCCDTLRCRSDC
jgi:hypothetical protein